MDTKEQSRLWYQNHRGQKLQYEKEYRKKHHDLLSQKNHILYLRLKQQVLEHYSHGKPKCAVCGEDNFDLLVLDHINNDGKTHRLHNHIEPGTQTYVWARKNNFPPIFQVLCAYHNNANQVKLLPVNAHLEEFHKFLNEVGLPIPIFNLIHDKFDNLFPQFKTEKASLKND